MTKLLKIWGWRALPYLLVAPLALTLLILLPWSVLIMLTVLVMGGVGIIMLIERNL